MFARRIKRARLSIGNASSLVEGAIDLANDFGVQTGKKVENVGATLATVLALTVPCVGAATFPLPLHAEKFGLPLETPGYRPDTALEQKNAAPTLPVCVDWPA